MSLLLGVPLYRDISDFASRYKKTPINHRVNRPVLRFAFTQAETDDEGDKYYPGESREIILLLRFFYIKDITGQTIQVLRNQHII